MTGSDVLNVTLSLLAVIATGCLVHYVTLAALYPISFCKFDTEMHGGGYLKATWKLSVRGRIYLAFVYIGGAAFGYFGFYGMLFWMPDSWGWRSGDDGWSSLRVAISVAGAFVSPNVIGALASLAYAFNRKVELEDRVKNLDFQIRFKGSDIS